MPRDETSEWTLLPPEGDFAELVGPIYTESATSSSMGLLCTLVEPRHCNTIGICHGAMIAMLMDQAMGMAIVAQSPTMVAPTISLTIDYLQGAQLGAKLICTPLVLRVGKTVAFCEARIESEAGLIALATGKFRMMPAQAR